MRIYLKELSLFLYAAQGWSEKDVKEMVIEYVIRKPMLIERLVPARILFKQRRKYIQTEIDRLCAGLDSAI
ncbi:hypothetical protein E7W42_02635 [Cronobacter sakazakii]|nr:hypothetical protein [Cronobacter sakazakii]